jgi:arginyl-tRNA--protein-N-Asp/Glu arginylyltransferase
MTRDISPDIGSIKLCLTEPHDCSYLEGRRSTTAFVDPELSIDKDLYSRMTAMGFRRSGPYLYAPMCAQCSACIPTRVPVAQFKFNRTQKRCWNKNTDIVVEQLDAINIDEHFPLYARYINERHSDGDMYPPSRKQFEEFLGKPWETTQFLELRLAGKLIGCAVLDVLNNGLSAIYSYFDPLYTDRGLGNLAVLLEISLAQRLGLDYLYLGFWIADCAKMKYKANYRPLELYRENNWQLAD